MLRIPLPEDDGFALALHEKGPSVFCVVFPYLSLSCLFGALACYLSFLSYPSPHAWFSPSGDFGSGPSHRGVQGRRELLGKVQKKRPRVGPWIG